VQVKYASDGIHQPFAYLQVDRFGIMELNRLSRFIRAGTLSSLWLLLIRFRRRMFE
jgi:hypothetical protein